jgi:glycosyltransferase involved in cell wall biosynthesis
MKYLPESYKILLLGGSHPESKGNLTLSEIALSKVNQYPDRITTTFIPDDAEIHQYMEKCDVIVAPYLPVNLSSSGAITHAISSGIPVIASNINAFIELYKEAECFYPIDYNSPEQLAAALIDLPKNVHLRNKLISASRSITEKHSWENMVKSLHDEL